METPEALGSLRLERSRQASPGSHGWLCGTEDKGTGSEAGITAVKPRFCSFLTMQPQTLFPCL